MRSILHTAASNAFDLFLATGVIIWAYRFPKTFIEIRRDKGLSITSAGYMTLAYLVCFAGATVASFLLYQLRIFKSIATREDAVYSLTGFFMLIIPAFYAVFRTTYLEPNEDK